MPEKENIEKILSELREVLHGLSGDELMEPAQKAGDQPLPAAVAKEPPAPLPAETTPEPKPAPVKQPLPAAVAKEPPAPLPAETAPEPKPAAAKPPVPAKSPVIPSKDVMRYAVYYTAEQIKGKDQFLLNLAEFMKKTSKKPINLEETIDETIDLLSANWEGMSEKAKSEGIEAIFLVHGDNYDSMDLKGRFAAYNIFFEGIQESKINKKITYIDLVIELMLAKKPA